MLILTRRIGETLKIGDNIDVTVLNVQGGQVRLGINAPRDVAVHREEIYTKIKEEQNQQPGLARTAGPDTKSSKGNL